MDYLCSSLSVVMHVWGYILHKVDLFSDHSQRLWFRMRLGVGIGYGQANLSSGSSYDPVVFEIHRPTNYKKI